MLLTLLSTTVDSMVSRAHHATVGGNGVNSLTPEEWDWGLLGRVMGSCLSTTVVMFSVRRGGLFRWCG